MTSPVDPARRLVPARKVGRGDAHARRAAGQDEAPEDEANQAGALPADGAADAAAFAAQLMGQERRRGLRAGYDTLDRAKSAYARTEWSGGADRRARNGGISKTKI